MKPQNREGSVETFLKEGCVFCEKILTQRDGYFIFEDELVLAFLDHAPVEMGHILIIPKRHFQDIFDIDNTYYMRIQETAKSIAPLLMKTTGADGLNISQNNGPCANQRVMHYHLHLIPRFCRERISWERKKFTHGEMLDISSRIRKSISEQ